MHLAIVCGVGAALGLVSTLGVLFVRSDAGKLPIVAAGTLRGLLVALLVASSAHAARGWLGAAGLGALYGGLVGTMIILSHGKSARQHAKYILAPSVVSGALIGVLVMRLGA